MILVSEILCNYFHHTARPKYTSLFKGCEMSRYNQGHPENWLGCFTIPQYHIFVRDRQITCDLYSVRDKNLSNCYEIERSIVIQSS